MVGHHESMRVIVSERASCRLGSWRWRLDRCGLWVGLWQLQTRDEEVDASLELVEYRQQVGRRLRVRHSALDAHLAWRHKKSCQGSQVRPARLAGAEAPHAAKALRHSRRSGTAPFRRAAPQPWLNPNPNPALA